MRYLSIDIEATGLNENDYMIEFAMVPFDSETQTLAIEFEKSFYLQCPPFEKLRPQLSDWVIEHNRELIDKAASIGMHLDDFRQVLENYLRQSEIRNYFRGEKITLFGKSMNAIDLPFLSRDLGWDFMRKYFMHRVQDLSCFVYGLIDLGKLPAETVSGSALMKYLGMGEVAHTALADAKNTAIMYNELLKKFT